MSLVGGQRPPFRTPCAGTVLCVAGKQFRHGKWSEKNVPKFVNDTKPYFGDAVNGPAPLLVSSPCGLEPPPNCTCCYNWKTGDTPGGCGPWTIEGDVPANHFVQDGVIDFLECRKKGFKNVQAWRSWHGKFGYWPTDGRADVELCCNRCTGGYPAESYHPTPNQTKYLSILASFVYQKVSNCSDTWHYESTIGTTVDAQKGTYEVIANSGPPPAEGLVAIANWNFEDAIIYFMNFLDSSWSEGVACENGIWTQKIGVKVIQELGISGSTCYYHKYGYVNTSDAPDCHYDTTLVPGDMQWGVLNEESVAFSETTMVYTQTARSGAADAKAETSTIVSVTLSDPNSFRAVMADVNYLLAFWPLNDDTLYPWREDAYYGIGPMVSRNERDNFAPPITTTPDTGADVYDGAVLGAPRPAGYQRSFDFRHENLVNCPAEDDMPAYLDTNSYGAWTPDYLPQNCTQWSSDWFPMPTGAGIYYKTSIWTTMGVVNPPYKVVAQKWAETLVPWQSYNLARPAGADKFAYDETTDAGVSKVLQVVSISGSGAGAVVTLSDDFGDPITPAFFGTYTGQIWGGHSVDGFYLLASVSGSTATLGAKQFNVPGGWASPSYDTDTAFGRLRFADVPGIIGRVAVTTVADEAPVKLTITSSPYLALNQVADENVDILDFGLNVLASNVTVTRVGDTQFTVPTSYSTISAAKWIVAHGAAAWYWNDNYPKGNYLLLDFLFDYRASGEAARINTLIADCTTDTLGGALTGCECSRLGSPITPPPTNYKTFHQTPGCLPLTPCAPSVVCISPNGETFENGVTYDFPAVDGDERYGSQWQSCVVQAVTDPLWQIPHKPPSPDPDAVPVFNWSEDGGNCTEDSLDYPPVLYYPHAPLVEAMSAVPAGAPALPSGLQFGFLSPVDHTTGDVAHPPALGFGDLPWTFYNQACGCIHNAHRFANIYSSFLICYP